MSTITVIIPIYNMAGFLPRAVQSVVNNQFNKTQIIIVDDGSEDASLKVAGELAQPIRATDIWVNVKSIAHGGKAAALNEGLKFATGDFITFLDADDELPPKSLSLRMQKLRETNGDIALGEFEVFSEGRVTGKRSIPAKDIATLKTKMLYGWKTPFHLNAMLIKKELIERVGLFDEQLHRGQEKDYSLRLLKLEPDIAFIHEPVYCYRKYRGMGQRVKLRLKTFQYTTRLLAKHTSGMQRILVLTWNTGLELLKFIFNLFGSYKK